MLLADEKLREVVDPKEGREQGTEGLLWWERTTRQLETPDLQTTDGSDRGRIYEIDVRVVWEQKRQLEVRTLRMVSPAAGQTVFSGAGTPPAGTARSSGAVRDERAGPRRGLHDDRAADRALDRERPARHRLRRPAHGDRRLDAR
jgi:hypothetical protein